MSKFKKFLIGISLVIITSGLLCFPYYDKTISFEENLDIINNSNANIPISDLNIKDFAVSILQEDTLTSEEYEKLFLTDYKNENKTTITKVQATSDIALYFKALKCNYAPYNYYGGDEIFLKAKENLLKLISDKDTISVDELTKYMKNSTSFLPDRHFYIGKHSHSLDNTSMYYYSPTIEIHRNSIGYYSKYGNVNYYIKNINNDADIEKYIKLSVNSKGELIYNLGLLKVYLGEDVSSIKVTFYRGSMEYHKNIELKLAGNYPGEIAPSPEYFRIDTIPILSIRNMPYHISTDGLDFTESANKIKDAPVSIIDLRGNHGGDILAAFDFIKERFGVTAESNGLFLLLYGRADAPLSYYDYNGLDGDVKTMNLEKMDEYYYSHTPNESSTLNYNDNLIFVLTDKETSSAAEFFVENLKDFTNVVVVGTNTYGMLESSNIELGYLPNSHIEFSYGNWLRVYDESFFKEGEGLKPDIWVDGQDALDLTLKLITNYDLVKAFSP